jgi:S-DNA-T family DNA segregation ATPase FtsK/SpoIIIE
MSVLFGVIRIEFKLFYESYELSGAVGKFIGSSIGVLLGGFGSLIFLFTLLAIVIMVYFRIKPERILEFLKSLFEKSEDKQDDKIKVIVPDSNGNGDKPKNGKDKKKKTIFTFSDSSDAAIEEETPLNQETSIKIVRKEEPQSPEKKVEPAKEEKPVDDKKVTDSKKKKNIEPEIDENIEKQPSDLPEQWDEKIVYKKPGLDLLNPVPQEDYKVAEEELKKNAELLKDKLSLFDIEIQDITVTPGPVVTLYEIVPAPGVKISKIVSLEHDIALALAARGIRIIAPIPGKSAIGVEIPNSSPSLVVAKSVLSKLEGVDYELPLALGKDIAGEVLITDLSKMPHMLIAGSTGSGKSVGINMIITSLLYAKDPSQVKFVIIDPKKIELSFYKKLRRHFLAVSPDLDEEIITVPQNAVLALKSVEYEMEKRYDKLAKAGVRNIIDYNAKVIDPARKPKDIDNVKHHPIPYIIVIIDELADLMITAGKEVEEPIARLAQLARAVGIHLVLATQRPSVNVITGVIKANFSSRIAYQVATKIDSRTILDMNGAEQLLGRGDMLFLPGGTPKPFRIQNAFITTDEVERITEAIYKQKGYSKLYYLPSLYEKKKETVGRFLDDLDPLFEEAAKVVVRHQQGSVSLLQRRLKLGYARAARIVDQLEEAGIVGPNDGSKAREVTIENDEQLEVILRSL